jgi:acetamidase/formamidase
VRIETIDFRQDWGYNAVRPLRGGLAEDFRTLQILNIPIDIKKREALLPWGLTVPLKPFFGIMAVAPRPEYGMVSSIEPREYGGNMDNKELVAGTTLYLPVFVAGAMFSCGDGHAAQGDGEVNVTAIETALTGTFELVVRRDLTLPGPSAETKTHFITMAFDPDLDRCAERALSDMIDLVVTHSGITRAQAYALCSIAADLRITQTVNQHKGVHCMLARSVLRRV